MKNRSSNKTMKLCFNGVVMGSYHTLIMMCPENQISIFEALIRHLPIMTMHHKIENYGINVVGNRTLFYIIFFLCKMQLDNMTINPFLIMNAKNCKLMYSLPKSRFAIRPLIHCILYESIHFNFHKP